jgi:hypothetical protein
MSNLKTIYFLTCIGEFDPHGKSKQKRIGFCSFFYFFAYNLALSFDATIRSRDYRRKRSPDIQAHRTIAYPNKYGRFTDLQLVASILCDQYPYNIEEFEKFWTKELDFLVTCKDLQPCRQNGSSMTALLCFLLEEYFRGFVNFMRDQNLNQSTIDGDFAILVLIFWYAAVNHQNVDSDSAVAQSFIELVAMKFSDVFGDAPGQNWNLKLKVWVQNNISTFKTNQLYVDPLEVELLECGPNSPPHVKLGVPYFVLDPLKWLTVKLEVVHPEALMAGWDRESPQYKFLELVLDTRMFPHPAKIVEVNAQKFNTDSLDDFPVLGPAPKKR